MPASDIIKLKAKCSCIDNTLTDTQINELIAPALYSISELTGWVNSECSTFYKSARTEKFHYTGDMHNCLCRCMEPFFLKNRLVDTSSISAKLYIVSSSGQTTYTIPTTAIYYSDIEDSISVDLSMQVLDSTNTLVYISSLGLSCSRYYVVFTYDAGYVEAPDCIISSICNIYNYLNLKKVGGDCSASSCSNLDSVEWNARLTSLGVGDIKYTFDYDENQIKNTFSSLVFIVQNQIHTIDNLIVMEYVGIF